MAADIGWTALQWPGMEHVIVSADPRGLRADSRLILAEERLASVRYQLTCGSGWRFTGLTIGVTSAAEDTTLTLSADEGGRWVANGQRLPDLDGCVDIDINCSPLTNTLPIRRLDWSAGLARDLDVAYVSVPELGVRRVRQRYSLLERDEHRNTASFRYESGTFRADLQVDGDGFVVDYPGLWRRVTVGGPVAI